MFIKSIETFDVAIPLTKPFKTALRTVAKAYKVYMTITTSDGIVGSCGISELVETPQGAIIKTKAKDSKTCIDNL